MKFSLSTLQLLVALVAFSVTSPVKAQESIAITEFMNEPRGTQSLTEWIELYNFGASTVNLTGWNLKDDDTDNATIPNTSIPAGGFLILARNKAQFEADWLAGFSSSQVVQWVPSGATTTFALSASADEIILRNASNTEVWRVAWANDDVDGYGTFLAINSFTTRNYGNKANPGIVRNGTDDTGTLGYQGTNFSADPMLYSGANYSGGGHDWGSPLRGNYTGVPAPGTTTRVINAAAAGTPFDPAIRGIALHDIRMDESRYFWAVPKANEVSDGSSIRGVAGGLFADIFDWRVRNGMPRPPTLEFLRYQRDNLARLYITVNTRGLVQPDPGDPGHWLFYTTDTLTLASMAADWVRYCNHIVQVYRDGDPISDVQDQNILNSLVWNSAWPGDNWSKLLTGSETSVPKVMYWEIGNEPTVNVTGGIAVNNGMTLSPTEYYNRYKAITQAMLAQDPTIKVGPCVVNYSREEDHLNLLLADHSVQVDFISYHPYGTMDDETSTVQTNLQANLQGVYSDQYTFAKGIRDLVTSNGRALNSVGLVASEVNVSNWPSNEKELIGTMAHTIGTVETIFTFARLGLDASHYWIWPAAQWDGFEYPVFTAFAQLRDHMGDILLDAYAETDQLRLYTTKKSSNGEVAIWGLNCSPTADKQVQLQVSGIPAGYQARLYTLGNPSGATTLLSRNLPYWIPPGAANDVTWTSAVPPVATPSNFTVTFKAATINMILFEPNLSRINDWTMY